MAAARIMVATAAVLGLGLKEVVASAVAPLPAPPQHGKLRRMGSASSAPIAGSSLFPNVLKPLTADQLSDLVEDKQVIDPHDFVPSEIGWDNRDGAGVAAGFSPELALAAKRENQFASPQHELKLLIEQLTKEESVDALTGGDSKRKLDDLDTAVALSPTTIDPNFLLSFMNTFIQGVGSISQGTSNSLIQSGATTTTPPPAHQIVKGFLSFIEGLQQFHAAGSSILGNTLISQALLNPST